MVIGALPFSFVMVLMGISLIVAIVGDLERKKQGLQTIYTEEDEAPVEAENGEQVK